MKMFNVPNLITAGNLLCGIFAIILAFAGRIDIAPYFIFAAAVLDFFDGFAARLLKQHSELGKQLDSLADVISFGLAPGLIMFVLISNYLVAFNMNYEEYMLLSSSFPFSKVEEPSYSLVFRDIAYVNVVDSIFDIRTVHGTMWKELGLMIYLPFVSLLIPVFSMFRLAKFNIDTRQSDSFIGLPTPANTIFFMTFPLVLTNDSMDSSFYMVKHFNPLLFIPIILVMCYLLIAELPLFALKFKSFGWKGNEIRFIFLITCGILIFTLGWWSLAIIILLYLILSIINNITRKKENV